MELNAEKIKKSISYIENVLSEWTLWQKHHRSLVQSMHEILALINEQEQKIKELEKCVEYLSSADDYVVGLKSKIEELTVELEAMRGATNSYKIHNENITEENERLNRILELYALKYGTISDKIE